MTRTITLTLLTLTLASNALARAVDPAALVAARQALKVAVDAATPEDLLKARGQFEGLLDVEPKSAPLHYWVAVADWRAVPVLLRAPGSSQAQRFCKDGLEHAERAIQLDPRFAEAHAMKAALLGLSLNFDPEAMMSVGPEIEETMARALKMDAKNPRIRFLAALSDLHKPKFVGGGPEVALAGFQRSIELFASARPADSTAPDWGQDDALLWAGRAAMALNDARGARDFFRRALAANPDNAWVRGRLLPEAEQALADSASAPGTAGSPSPAAGKP